MTVLEALAILEAAVMECRRREIRTPVLKAALDSLDARVQPPWLIPQFRYHAFKERSEYVELEAKQQLLCATFPGIRISVRELIGKEIDTLARKFHKFHDLKTKAELGRLAEEYRKLGERWVFVET